MAFTVIPSLVLHGGRCVRYLRSSEAPERSYPTPPEAAAQAFRQQGATTLHVVDLEGAQSGEPRQLEAVATIRRAVPGVVLQVGGGIRSGEAAEAVLAAGADRIILGTAAVDQPDLVMELARRHGDRVGVAVDVADGLLTTRNRREESGWYPDDIAEKLAGWGIRWLVVTDVAREATLGGPNLELALRVAVSSRLPVLVCGGIESVADVERAMRLEHLGLAGAIVGTALFEGRLSLDELLRSRFVGVAPRREIRKVLVVDDEPDVLKIAAVSLGSVGGWQVGFASTAAAALESVARDKPDVVLLDVMMPGVDGPGTLARLRSQAASADLPVIFITAKAQRSDLERYRSLGVAGVILKPFDPLTLPHDVRRIVEGGVALADAPKAR